MASLMVSGGRPLRPRPLEVRGFKHALVQILAACAAGGPRLALTNVPDIEETDVLSEILVRCGAAVDRHRDRLEVDARGLSNCEVPDALSRRVHGSLYLVPALLGRLGEVRFGRSGGCRIGDPGRDRERPVDHMVDVLRRFGATITASDGGIQGTASGFVGCTIDMMIYSEQPDLLTGPLVSGATKTAILAASAARGTSTIVNPYPKPDVTDLVDFLEASGHAVVRARDSIQITPSPVSLDGSRLVPHEIISDLTVVMTYITLAVVQRIPIQITGLTVARLQRGLSAELAILDAMGVTLRWEDHALWIHPPPRVHGVDIDVTSIGIYSDHQPLFALMLLGADRVSTIRERVWRHRFAYAGELRKLGAALQVEGDSLLIRPSTLSAKEIRLEASDLRGAVVLLLAALGLSGPCEISGTEHLARGYEDLPGVLVSLGAEIRGASNQASTEE